ncbi:MAG: NAD-dependent SIR2 family protein deacetylase [Woeseiaceae bacterium]
MTESTESVNENDAGSLENFIRSYPKLTILSGAGCSTASGIPDYRDDQGNWKHRQPMQFSDFVGNTTNRQRYWAQSFSGWQRISNAKPNAAHVAIAKLEELGHVNCVITQNVDNLHREAGSRNVIDLHGVLHRVRCLDCDLDRCRREFQGALRESNPNWSAQIASIAPDGDASLTTKDFSSFVVPGCIACGGVLKPDVVFFGESVSAQKISSAREHLHQSDALLVVGSSLMVFSGYRFARDASEAEIPILILNRGTTRADDLATLKLSGDCVEVLSAGATRLAA